MKLSGDHEYFPCFRDLTARITELFAALDWLTHICCGVGKSGEAPSDNERADALVSAKRALAGKGAKPGECPPMDWDKRCPECGEGLLNLPGDDDYFCDDCEREWHIVDMGVPATKRVAEIRTLARNDRG